MVDSRSTYDDVVDLLYTHLKAAGACSVFDRLIVSFQTEMEGKLRTLSCAVEVKKVDSRTLLGVLALLHLVVFTQWCSYASHTRRDRIVGFGTWTKTLPCNRVRLVEEIGHTMYGTKAPHYCGCDCERYCCLKLQMHLLMAMEIVIEEAEFGEAERRSLKRKIEIRKIALEEQDMEWGVTSTHESCRADCREKLDKHVVDVAELLEELVERFSME